MQQRHSNKKDRTVTIWATNLITYGNSFIHDVKFLKKHSQIDRCGGETSWTMAGYGEAESGLTGQISKKPCVTKGD